MKKLSITLAILSSIGVSQVGFTDVNGGNGTVNFQGQIIQPSCQISPGSQNQTVNLGQVLVTDVVNNTVTPRAFEFALINCIPNPGTAELSLIGESDENNSNLLRLTTGEDTATGVGIRVRYLDNAEGVAPRNINISSEQSRVISRTLQEGNGGNNTFNFDATYIASGSSSAIGPGTANSTLVINLVYK